MSLALLYARWLNGWGLQLPQSNVLAQRSPQPVLRPHDSSAAISALAVVLSFVSDGTRCCR